MIWIIDCSFSSALFLPDEKSDRISNFFADLSNDDEIFVPALWWFELTNVFTVCVRRGRLNYSDVVNILSLFDDLKLITDVEFGPEYSKELYKLSQLYKLSAYDAAYLELAIRKNGTLNTLDDNLNQAAKSAGIKSFEI